MTIEAKLALLRGRRDAETLQSQSEVDQLERDRSAWFQEAEDRLRGAGVFEILGQVKKMQRRFKSKISTSCESDTEISAVHGDSYLALVRWDKKRSRTTVREEWRGAMFGLGAHTELIRGRNKWKERPAIAFIAPIGSDNIRLIGGILRKTRKGDYMLEPTVSTYDFTTADQQNRALIEEKVAEVIDLLDSYYKQKEAMDKIIERDIQVRIERYYPPMS